MLVQAFGVAIDLGQRVEHLSHSLAVAPWGVQRALADGVDISGDISVFRAIAFDLFQQLTGPMHDVVDGSGWVREGRAPDGGAKLCAFAPIAIIAAIYPLGWISNGSAWGYENYENGDLILELLRPLAR